MLHLVVGQDAVIGDLQERHELKRGGAQTRTASAAVLRGTAVPAVLHGEGTAGLGLDGLGRLGLAGGGADDDIRDELAALDRGLGVEELDAL